jgi:hypothetical protein
MLTGHAGFRSTSCLPADHHSTGRVGGGDLGLVGLDARTGLESELAELESERERLSTREQRFRLTDSGGECLRGLRLSGLFTADGVALSCGGPSGPCFSGDWVASFRCGLVAGDGVAFSCGGLGGPCFTGDGVAIPVRGLRLGGLDFGELSCGGCRFIGVNRCVLSESSESSESLS